MSRWISRRVETCIEFLRTDNLNWFVLNLKKGWNSISPGFLSKKSLWTVESQEGLKRRWCGNLQSVCVLRWISRRVETRLMYALKGCLANVESQEGLKPRNPLGYMEFVSMLLNLKKGWNNILLWPRVDRCATGTLNLKKGWNEDKGYGVVSPAGAGWISRRVETSMLMETIGVETLISVESQEGLKRILTSAP